jgi:hypothetical protein
MALKRKRKVRRPRVQSAAQGRAYHERGRLADELYTMRGGKIISEPKPYKGK